MDKTLKKLLIALLAASNAVIEQLTEGADASDAPAPKAGKKAPKKKNEDDDMGMDDDDADEDVTATDDEAGDDDDTNTDGPSLDDVKAAALKAIKGHKDPKVGRANVKKLMKTKFKVASTDELDESDYEAAIKAFKTMKK